MLKKLKKGTTTPKIASQHQSKKIQHKKEENNSMDEKVKYARSTYLNARRSRIKSVIGYKIGDKHNSRVNTNCQEFIKFTKANIQNEKSKTSRLLTMLLMLILMLLMFLISQIMIFMLCMCL